MALESPFCKKCLRTAYGGGAGTLLRKTETVLGR